MHREDIESQPQVDERTRVPWGWRDLLKAAGIAVVVFFVVIVVARLLVALLRLPLGALAQALARAGLSPHVSLLIVSSLLAYGAAAVAVWLGIVRPYRVSWAVLGFRAAPIGRFAILFLAYPLTLTTAGAVTALEAHYVLHGHLTNPQVQQLAGGVTRTAPNVVGLLLLVAVLAPLAEETIFRGVIYQWLRKSLPIWAAAIISAALFAAAHAIPIIFPWLFVTGIALALVFEYCRTLYGSMLLHGLINGINVTVLIGTLHK